jgi:hypothetical protein
MVSNNKNFCVFYLEIFLFLKLDIICIIIILFFQIRDMNVSQTRDVSTSKKRVICKYLWKNEYHADRQNRAQNAHLKVYLNNLGKELKLSMKNYTNELEKALDDHKQCRTSTGHINRNYKLILENRNASALDSYLSYYANGTKVKAKELTNKNILNDKLNVNNEYFLQQNKLVSMNVKKQKILRTKSACSKKTMNKFDSSEYESDEDLEEKSFVSSPHVSKILTQIERSKSAPIQRSQSAKSPKRNLTSARIKSARERFLDLSAVQSNGIAVVSNKGNKVDTNKDSSDFQPFNEIDRKVLKIKMKRDPVLFKRIEHLDNVKRLSIKPDYSTINKQTANFTKFQLQHEKQKILQLVNPKSERRRPKNNKQDLQEKINEFLESLRKMKLDMLNWREYKSTD